MRHEAWILSTEDRSVVSLGGLRRTLHMTSLLLTEAHLAVVLTEQNVEG